MTDETTLTVHGERELAARTARLFGETRREFFCAANDLRTWYGFRGAPGRFGDAGAGEHGNEGAGLGAGEGLHARGEIVRRLRARVAGGVTVRKLYTPAVLADEQQRLHLFDVASAGGLVRVRAATLPQEAIVIDRRVMIVAGRHGARGRAFTITTAPALVEGVHALMRATWDAGVPFADYLAREDSGLDAQALAVLRALAAGLTDAAGARRVGMSVRTYRRRVAELMSVLEAGSRFQAGVNASRRGLTGA
ncbi:DNA-binding response regulator, NarL/FixJ family, contains REC and HTH domains [Actinacidiphila yanglinensis]|uniref:DNA-binding response regulator, NarL/FixJ family, contains REC and HTH domains n=1 Tax=Actinacidiphila yanglinensis TaxID=310779 RepID=A0A1H5VRT4_9ACTN|nr:DNA-binding response regulator [Actinacidiphila yanglinensis]SEF89853.1 DNA-binding response regulator, NarL/FixJ family, contains REC and HTH domains [Actinacidiphila yanglinensis]